MEDALQILSRFFQGNELVFALLVWALIHYILAPGKGLIEELRYAFRPENPAKGIKPGTFIQFLDGLIEEMRQHTKMDKEIFQALADINKSLKGNCD